MIKEAIPDTLHMPMQGTDINTNGTSLHGLLPALQRLDSLLEQAVTQAENLYGPEAGQDWFRGLYVSQEEVVRLFSQQPGQPTLHPNGQEPDGLPADAAPDGSRLDWLKQAFGLSTFDMDVLLMALAPELDRRYERIYAYLQDHVARRRPSVDLILHLLCNDVVERLERRAYFAPESRLRRYGLIRLIPDSEPVQASLLSSYAKIDPQIVNYVLHQDGLDDELASYCQPGNSAPIFNELPLAITTRVSLLNTARQAWLMNAPLILHFHGVQGVGKHMTADALAQELGSELLTIDMRQLLQANSSHRSAIARLLQYARLYSVVPYFMHIDVLFEQSQMIHFHNLMKELGQFEHMSIIASEAQHLPQIQAIARLVPIRFDIPNFASRLRYWQRCLDEIEHTLAGDEEVMLAGRFRLTPQQIEAAALTSVHLANQRAQQPDLADMAVTLDDLFVAARAQSGHGLASLARKIDTRYRWEDIVLPEDALAQLYEICDRVAEGQRVLGEWGFGRKLSMGKGINVLFAGPSGAGKTMAAEVIANELGLDLYKIDLSGVVSKYIGETEKNLDKIFTAAENANVILFFDEADAIFGKRSEVSDAHDRYANIEISYLLQKMEEYNGVAILATNLRQNLDDAFIRRMAFAIHFPFPDPESRRLIWEGIWPADTPLTDDVDLELLAERFKLSGGNIKNVALAAAFLAATDSSPITMKHFQGAIRREYQKMGKVLSEVELTWDSDL